MSAYRDLRRIVRRGVRVARGRMLLAGGVDPVSRTFGNDRGQPIHRYYIDWFLREHAEHIRGHVLEFHDPGYVTTFGKDRPSRIDILDLEADNPHATIVADLTRPNDVASDTFDCIVCVHVLHLVYEADRFTSELYRMLAPGGTLLVAMPGTSMIDHAWTEYRRWTALGVETLLGQYFEPSSVLVESYGNSLAAAAEMRGLAADELAPWELRARDSQFPVEVCGLAVKSDA